MKKLQYNKETGILEVWEDGKKVGEIITMGDEINGRRESNSKKSSKRSNG